MKRLSILIGVICLGIIVAVMPFVGACAPKAPAPAAAPAPAGPVGPSITLKISHQWAEGDVRDRMARELAALVTERTGGSVTFTFYPASSLIAPKEQWDAVRTGALDIMVLPLDYASGKVPQFSITLMPCITPNMKAALSWKDKPIGQAVDKLCLDNDIIHAVWAWCDGGPASRVRQIVLPEDVAGQKMRAAGSKFEFMLNAAGAAITSMPSSEIYHAMSTGVLDSALTSSASWCSYKLYEQVDYINVPRDYCIWFMEEGVFIGMKAYNKMSPEQQKIWDAAAAEIQDTWVLPNFLKDVEILQVDFKEAGVEMHYMTADEWNVWLEFAKKTAWKEYADTVEGGQELLDLALAAID